MTSIFCSNLQVGDHVTRTLEDFILVDGLPGVPTHHGIVSATGERTLDTIKVIHVHGDNKRNTSVREVALRTFLGRASYPHVLHHADRDRVGAHAAAYARSRLGAHVGKYSLVWRNCETFVLECICFQTPISYQVRRTGIACAAGLTAALLGPGQALVSAIRIADGLHSRTSSGVVDLVSQLFAFVPYTSYRL
jgi:hypothetical protein